jgi:hypothetical protein
MALPAKQAVSIRSNIWDSQNRRLISIGKFGEVTTKMLGTDAVINTTDIALDIDNHGMDPGQQFHRISSVQPPSPGLLLFPVAADRSVAKLRARISSR